VTDEIYQFTVPYSRSRLRVLLSVDAAKTSIILDRIGMVHRSDNDFAISWVKSYGKGRVFYCALGHDHEIFWNPVILQHYLDGIQFALGDLKANTTPSAMIKTVDISTK
jgi:type 1 glutamine amidotransferase